MRALQKCVSKAMHGLVPYVVGAAALVIGVQHGRVVLVHDVTACHTVRATAWCIGLLLWPFLWQHTIDVGDLRSVATLGLLWPYVLFAADSVLAGCAAETTPGLAIDAGTVNGLCFALAGLLSASSDPAHKRLFVVPVLLFVCVVMPQVHGGAGKPARAVLCVQKVALACATGLLLTGLLYKPIGTTCV